LKTKVSGSGVILCQATIELESIMITHFRKNTAIWDILAYVGGFSVTLTFFAR
jgi:hypothetical protein